MKWQKVTIFISSTFNDMHAERDYLIKDVFPELREWCEERKIHLVDVDLRWGVTEADSHANNTVLACLRNIDESRPFFLCFLGQRRGWVPEEKDVSSETSNLYPDVPTLIGKHSVTEMEIEHALLAPMRHIVDGKEKKESPVAHALFYFRNDTYTGKLTPAQQKIFTNESEVNKDAADRELKDYIAKIKEQGRRTCDYNCEWDKETLSPELATVKFTKNESCGRLTRFEVNGKPLKDLIVEQLKEEIRKEFPDRKDVEATAGLQRDLDQQDLFLDLNSEGFIAREGDFDALNDYLTNDKDGLFVLTAPAGYGKSMLLANFVRRAQEEKRYNRRFYSRFCGASDLSSQTYSLWKSIFDEAEITCPANLNDLQNEIENRLKKLAESPSLILIDAINQLPDGTEMLKWLPEKLPPGLKIILSMKEDETDKTLAGLMDDLKAKNEEGRISLSRVKPLENKEEKKKLINEYLSKYLKALDNTQIETICAFEGSANPLYLKILLSELRIFGSFEQLGVQIQKFGATPREAFNAVLERLEKDANSLGIDSEAFATALFGLLANARMGLSEAELTPCLKAELPGVEKEKLVQAIRLFFRQVRPFMARRERRTDYFYESFKLAAQERYAGYRIRHNQLLAGYFQEQADPGGNFTFAGQRARDFNELPYHLYYSQNTETLEKILGEYLWIRSKLNLTDVDTVAKDYEDYIERDRNHYLKLIGECLTLAAHILKDSKDQLPSQLWGRMMDFEDESIQNILEQAEETTKEPWLKPIRQCLPEPGAAQIRTLKGHSHSVGCVRFSPDGKILATSSFDRTCILWDVRTGNKITVLEGNSNFLGGTYETICFSPDGKILASILVEGYDENFILWNVQTGKKIIALDQSEVMFVCFSPDGKILASASNDNTCILWDAEAWTIIATLKGHSDKINKICFSPDGKIFASASDDGTCILWDTRSGKRIAVLEGEHTGEIYSICFSSDGRTFSYASRDYTCILWDISSGKRVSTLKGHSEMILDICFSPDGNMLASASYDKTCILWDAKTGNIVKKLAGHTSGINDICFSPDGKILASASSDNTCILWDVENGQKIDRLDGHTNKVNSICFSPNGNLFASASNDGTCILWNVRTGKKSVEQDRHTKNVHKICFLPDGKMLASASRDGTCILWNCDTGRRLKTLKHPFDRATSICFVTDDHYWSIDYFCFSPDGNILASVGSNSTCVLWNVQTGNIIRVLPEVVDKICFSPDGKMLASATLDNRSEDGALWNVQTGIKIIALPGAESYICFSPNGKMLAFASKSNTCVLWDIQKKKELCRLEGHSNTIRKICFSPDEKILASMSSIPILNSINGIAHKCILWNVETGNMIAPPENCTDFCFSPDGRIIAFKITTGYEQGILHWSEEQKAYVKSETVEGPENIILWDTQTCAIIATLKGHFAKIMDICFSPNGNILVSVSLDKSCIIWDIVNYKQICKLTTDDELWCAIVSPDDSLLSFSGNRGIVYFWSLENMKVLKEENQENVKEKAQKNENPYSDFEFHIREDNSVMISKFVGKAKYNCEVIIPLQYNSKKVTSIGNSAFYECNSLISIIIPKSVTRIGKGAFWNCSSLTSIAIPPSITIIEEEVFSGCWSLTSVTIPESVTKIGKEAFFACKSLTSITIPEGVTTIGKDVFIYCPQLTIYCNAGSYAEKYAKENNIPCRPIEAAATTPNHMEEVKNKEAPKKNPGFFARLLGRK